MYISSCNWLNLNQHNFWHFSPLTKSNYLVAPSEWELWCVARSLFVEVLWLWVFALPGEIQIIPPQISLKRTCDDWQGACDKYEVWLWLWVLAVRAPWRGPNQEDSSTQLPYDKDAVCTTCNLLIKPSLTFPFILVFNQMLL